MTNFDVQAAFESLRYEIQNDRIATQKVITDGFKGLNDKLDEQVEKAGDLDNRISVIEDRQTIFGRGLWALVVSFVGGIVTYIMQHMKGGH